MREIRDVIKTLFIIASKVKASDIHFTVGIPPVFRIDGSLKKLNEIKDRSEISEEIKSLYSMEPEIFNPLTPSLASEIAEDIADKEEIRNRLNTHGNVDMGFSIPGVSRFRINIYKQRGNYAVACRILPYTIQTLDELFPYFPTAVDVIKKLSALPRGLVLITGATGTGKSTTLAAIVDYINKNFNKHIITLEDPIEYTHKHDRSIVNQREVGSDVSSFAEGLRAALREDPDVILVGEMRDLETIATAITAAETGHLVLSTLHTNTAAETIERIIDVFPSNHQQQVRVQLSGILQGIISQQLLPRKDGTGRAAALEILIVNHAVRSNIREGKPHQIPSIIQTSIAEGMMPMDRSLAELVLLDIVELNDAEAHSVEPKLFRKYLGLV